MYIFSVQILIYFSSHIKYDAPKRVEMLWGKNYIWVSVLGFSDFRRLIFQQTRGRCVDKNEGSNSVGEGYIDHYSDRNIELWNFY